MSKGQSCHVNGEPGSHVQTGLTNVFKAHLDKQRRKERRYQMPLGRPNEQNKIFIPFVISQWFVPSRLAQDYIERIAVLVSQRTNEKAEVVQQRFYQRAAVTLARDVARHLLARIPLDPSNTANLLRRGP